jgi:hypothetical protein
MRKEIKEREVWLKCEVKRGMFHNEKFVIVRDSKGKPMAGIFPNTMIKDGALEAVVLIKKGNNLLITVPSANGYGFFLQSSFWVGKQSIVNKK